MGALQTEFEFTLPKGFVDASGTLHRRGSMRLATARDEIEPLRDPRVSDPDDPYLTLIVLSRVITRLGTLSGVTLSDIEGLFAADLAFLQDFYGVINFGTKAELDALRGSIGADAAPEDVPPPPSSEEAASAGEVSPTDEAVDPVPAPLEAQTLRSRSAVEEVPSGGRS